MGQRIVSVLDATGDALEEEDPLEQMLYEFLLEGLDRRQTELARRNEAQERREGGAQEQVGSVVAGEGYAAAEGYVVGDEGGVGSGYGAGPMGVTAQPQFGAPAPEVGGGGAAPVFAERSPVVGVVGAFSGPVEGRQQRFVPGGEVPSAGEAVVDMVRAAGTPAEQLYDDELARDDDELYQDEYQA